MHTSIGKGELSTNTDIDDLIITHWNNETIHHDTETPITYKRLNHLNFQYHLEIENPTKVERKVFIRLWLGFLTDENDLRFVNIYNIFYRMLPSTIFINLLITVHTNPNNMIKMDQFVKKSFQAHLWKQLKENL